MAERAIKGDYIGFTFGGVHSSELGLMRVSNGSRYGEDLLPPLQDKTAQVAGRDGDILFDTQYKTKQIKLSVAYDNMTEESFRKLKQLLADKKPKYLWFDETPYKQWLVKSANAQNFAWVCFDESKNIARKDRDLPETKRIYKGEGTITFSCFTPWAESRIQFLDDEVPYVWDWNRAESPKKLIQKYKEDFSSNLEILTLGLNYNFFEWVENSRLITSESWWGKYNKPFSLSETYLYSAGDIDTNLKIFWFSVSENKKFTGDKITLYGCPEEGKSVELPFFIALKSFILDSEDDGFIIDSKTKTIQGFKTSVSKDLENWQWKTIQEHQYSLTGRVYNKFHEEGDFFKLPAYSELYLDYYIFSEGGQGYYADYKHYYI